MGLIIGLFFSNALKSIAFVLLAFCGCFLLITKQLKKSEVKHPLVLSTLIIVVIYIISALVSNNKYYAWESIQNKIPLVFALLSLFSIKYNNREKKLVLYIASICAVLQSFYVYYFLLLNANNQQLYQVGRVLPVFKIHHVQIAVLIAITIIFLIHLITKETNKLIKIVATVIVSWLFIFLHVFAVRTGIVLLYFMLVLYSVFNFIHKKNKKNLLYISLFLGITLLSAINYIPTLRAKLNYTKYDLLQYTTNNKTLQDYSDSRRLISIKNGFDIANKNPIIGCGVGDIYDESKQAYQKKYPLINEDFYFLPHNQYVYFFSVFGYLVGSIVIVCFIFPAIYLLFKKNYLFSSIYFSLLLLSCWDAYFGTLFGTVLYTLVIGLSNKTTK